jgi:hypothetical protein
MLNYLFDLFSQIEDPRKKGRTEYPLPLILLIFVIGLMKGGNGWKDIRWLSMEEIERIKVFYPYLDKFPSVDTIARTVDRINKDDFNLMLSAIGSVIFETTKDSTDEQADAEGLQGGDSEINEKSRKKVIADVGAAAGRRGGSKYLEAALDGKTIRGATARGTKTHIEHATINGVMVEAVKVPDKTNEIKVVPELIDNIKDFGETDIERTVFTNDALITQRTIASTISDSGGKYFFSLKKNQHSLYDDVDSLFETGPFLYPDIIMPNIFESNCEKAHG